MTHTIDSFIGFYATQDLEATRDFYTRVLGLELAVDQGTCHIYRVTDTAFIGFCQREDLFSTDGILITVVTDDVDVMCERLTSFDVPLEKAPAHNPTYGIYHAFVRDPNNYLVEIQRFDDPMWRFGDAERAD